MAMKNQGIKQPHPPAFVLKLMDLAERAKEGDEDAMAQIRLAGEALDFAGGAKAMCDVQGLAHDHEIVLRGSVCMNGNLSGWIGNYWEHIPSWAKL